MQRTWTRSWLRQRDQSTPRCRAVAPMPHRPPVVVVTGFELATVSDVRAPFAADPCGRKRRQQRLERLHSSHGVS
jgi:hypothetical protein